MQYGVYWCRDSYLDLAIPTCQFYEHSPPQQKQIKSHPAGANLKDIAEEDWSPVPGCIPYTVWDRWEVREGDLTVRELVEHFRAFYGLMVWSVFYRGTKVLEELGLAQLSTGIHQKAALQDLERVIDCKLMEVSNVKSWHISH